MATYEITTDGKTTTVEADSGSSAGRASWLWPGDPVGEGAKTFGEQLKLPPQLFENGYPVQVNSGQPSGTGDPIRSPNRARSASNASSISSVAATRRTRGWVAIQHLRSRAGSQMT